jgi:hypothetical protein
MAVSPLSSIAERTIKLGVRPVRVPTPVATVVRMPHSYIPVRSVQSEGIFEQELLN